MNACRKGAPDRPRHPEPPGTAPTGRETSETETPGETPETETPAAEPESEEPTGIDWPTPGTEAPAPDNGPLGKAEHEPFEPTPDDDGDEDNLTPAGVEHEHFTGVPPPPPPPAAEVVVPAPEIAEDRGRDDLTWPAPNNNSAPAQSPGYLANTVDRLETVVGTLSGMVEKMMGATPSQNVYVTNNYNNVTLQNANVTSTSVTAGNVAATSTVVNGAAGNAEAPYYTPLFLPEPDMWPLGGVYADQVVVHLDDAMSGTSLYYSVNVSGTQGTPEEYTAPFVLGPGCTKVEAVAIKSGYNASAIKEAVFQVMDCNGDKCCNWRVVYLRFEAVLARLLSRQKEIPKEQTVRQKAKDAAEGDWLTAESKYQDAKISKKSAESGAEYARSFERKWGFAFSESKDDLTEMENRVNKKLRELLDERELILDIMAKLDSDQLSASGAMGMLQQSLAQCSACKSWRSMAESPGGNGAAGMFALASTLGGHQEVKNVKAILQEILDDLNERRALYEKMLSGARVQVQDNEQKLKKWQHEAAEMSAMVYKDEKRILENEKKSQEFAGTVEARKQALDRGKKFMKDDLDILQRHISAIRRILKRIRVALGACPSGVPEERYPAPTPAADPKTANRHTAASQTYDGDSKGE